MADIWWKAHPQDLHRLTDRVSSVYIERSHLDRDENAIAIINKRETVRLPAALVAVVLLGPGTRVTHGAMQLLADSGTAVCWVGEQGVRLYAAGLGPSRGAALLQRQAWLVSRPPERLRVARAMYGMRFPGEDVSELTMQQLRGREGTRVRKLYKQHADQHDLAWHGRVYKPGDAFAAGDDLNRMLSAANTALYGICHAVIVGLGASPGLGFVHTGAATSFVMDIADLYKADYTIPLAFELTAAGLVEERDARTALRDRIAETNLLTTIVRDIKTLLLPEGEEPPDSDANHLWDEHAGTVAGGVNWGVFDEDYDTELAEPDLDDQHIAVIGPELDTPSQGTGRS
ncbi:type I-E CRISPR-associated endonuclease Cas1e [Saccharopolyspora sp. NPDC047091]|uniref:type I-E CRISPR-associated endonuclease Cas1e n=1 Tax=Saccharopolyspora sp. NPDC047091 TaxID=3155924 RepID=UPI0033DCECC2